MKTIPKKWFTPLGIFLLLNVALAPSINAELKPVVHDDPFGILNTDATLSGYVNDTNMNPLEGALVRVSFHGTYEEDYSDAHGYYHVTNIPLCNCTKNCTASKPGFKTTSVQLSIDLNTRYDFVLLSDKIFYVGGNGPSNYTYIQDAIDNATTHDTIFVYNGTYPEHLFINKSLLLKGQDQYTTIITGTDTNTTITITADYTTVTGFTITHAGPTRDTAGILIHANHTYIHHNIITENTETGIHIPIITNDGTTYTTITHNTITHNNVGIYLQLCAHTLIHNNTITDNHCGIHTHIGFLINGCENTTIYYNTLENNTCGIDLYGGWDTTIQNNNFIRNKRSAKFYIETTAIWDHNYWDRPRMLPKIILGRSLIFIIMYPALNVDWHPAFQPYDIS